MSEHAEIQQFQSELIGNLELSLDSYIEMHITADNPGCEKLRKFVDRRDGCGSAPSASLL